MSFEQPSESNAVIHGVEFDGHAYTAVAAQEIPVTNSSPGTIPPMKDGPLDYLKLFTGIDLNPLLLPKPSPEPSGQRRVDVTTITPTTFDDIGGNQDAKRIMRRLAYGMKHPEIYKQLGTRPPKGILMHGPPGTGKTLLGKALAHEAGAPFYAPQIEDISSKWYGDSEKEIKKIFKEADSHNRPAIVFIDEIDAVAPSREFTQGGPSQRVVSALLNVLDGATPLKNVTLLAATNHKEGIDSALLRPGRFDRHIEVSLPDKQGLGEIFTRCRTAAEKVADAPLFDTIDEEAVVDRMKDFSGADVSEIIRRVLDERLDLVLEGQTPEGLVTTTDILHTLDTYERKSHRKQAHYGFAGRAVLGNIQPLPPNN